MTNRRQLLTTVGAGALALGWGAVAPGQLLATQELTPLKDLHIYIPGGAGGGWDQTGRALGAVIQEAGLAQHVTYENKGGKGGTLGLADFVARYDRDPAALLIGGMVMLGAISLEHPKVTLTQVSPIARLTSDYMVLAVDAGGKITSTEALIKALRTHVESVTFTGGSAGGVDHVLAAMIALQLRLDISRLKYLPTGGGAEAIALLHKGEAQVAISGFSEFQSEFDAKRLLPLAISSRSALYGVPSLQEQGVRTDLSNWRAVYAPGQITNAQRENLHHMVVAASRHPSWAQALNRNKWFDALLHGSDFANRLLIEQGMSEAMTLMLRRKG